MRHLHIFTAIIVITLRTGKVRAVCQTNVGTFPASRIFDAIAVFAYARSSGQRVGAGAGHGAESGEAGLCPVVVRISPSRFRRTAGRKEPRRHESPCPWTDAAKGLWSFSFVGVDFSLLLIERRGVSRDPSASITLLRR
jgi:hypothetical protein